MLSKTVEKEEQKSKKRSKIVIACISQNEFRDFLLPNIEESSWPYTVEFYDSANGTEALIEKLNENDSEVLITAWSSPKLPEDMRQQVPSLKYIAHCCGTICRFLPRKLIEDGIMVTNWGNVIADTVAEHCLLQTLGALRRMAKWQLDMHTKKDWRPQNYESFTLFGKKVGLHGFGVCSREFVKLVKPFGVKIQAYSPHVPDEIFEEFDATRANTLEELFSSNDIIVDLASLTPKTKGIVTEKLLRMIPEGGVFVNSGRGAVIDEDAMARVAKEGKIQFALDVFTQEPLPADSPLRGLDNVFLSPHIGGPTIDRRYMGGLSALENTAAYFRGETLNSTINTGQYDRMT